MSETEQPTEFIIHPTTPIGWGKLHGHPHSDLLLKENKTYSKWLIDQGNEFRYNATRLWVMKNMKDGDKINRYINLVIKDKNVNGNNVEDKYFPTFYNELLTLTRKYDFVSIHK